MSPYGDLARLYVGAALADVLNLAATISLLAISLSAMAAGARVIYALARDAIGPHSFAAHTSTRTGAPIVGLAICLLVFLVAMVVQRLNGTYVLNATFYALTLGTLSLLVAYMLATLGALRYLFLVGERKAPIWEMVIPIAGVAVLTYTLYKNTFGVEFPYDRFPIVVLIWLLVAIVIVTLVPKVRVRLARSFSATSEAVSASKNP